MTPEPTFTFVGGPYCPTLVFVSGFLFVVCLFVFFLGGEGGVWLRVINGQLRQSIDLGAVDPSSESGTLRG
jgi:hypothetical protein